MIKLNSLPKLVKEKIICSDKSYFIIPLSAKTKDGILFKLIDFSKWLDKNPDARLIDIAYTLGCRRNHYKFREAFVVSNRKELEERIEQKVSSKNESDYELKRHEDCQVTDERVLYKACSELSPSEYKLRIEQIATYYVQGNSFDFERFYQDHEAHIISMPTYPFAKDRYWVKIKSDEQNSKMHVRAVNQEDFSTILRKMNYAGPEGDCELTLYGDAFYLKDHKLGEERVLPGVVYLEMGYIIGKNYAPSKKFVLKNIKYLNPIKLLPKDEYTKVRIEFSTSSGEINYKVTSRDVSNHSHIHQCGTIEYVTDTEEEKLLPINEIKDKCSNEITGESCYKNLAKRGLKLGKTFQAMKTLYADKEEVFGVIELPQQLEPNFTNYYLHPSLLDGALETVVNLISNQTSLSLPCGVSMLKCYAPLEKNCLVYAKNSKEKVEDGEQKFDVSIMNHQGRLLVQIDGFTFKQMDTVNQNDAILNSNAILDQNETIHYYRQLWKEDNKTIGSFNENEVILLFGKEDPFCNELKKTLENQVIVITYGDTYDKIDKNYYVRKNHRSDIRKVFADVSANKPIGHILYACEKDIEFKKVVSSENFISEFFNVCKVSKEFDKKIGMIYLYNRSLANPFHEAVSSFIKSINLEEGNHRYKLLGLSDGETAEAVHNLVKELGNNANEDDHVCYDNGIRKIECMEPVFIENEYKTELLKDGGVYVITGGAGNLGEAFAEEINKTVSATIIIVGRSTAGNNQQELIQKLKSKGASVYYYACDITKKEAVTMLIQNVKQKHGSVDGIIHNAGVIEDAFLCDKSMDEMKEVMQPKIEGVLNIHEAIGRSPLDFFIMTSSIAAFTGNAGQCDYAFANQFMNKFAQYRKKQVEEGLCFGKTMSISWPLWKDTKMSVSKEVEHFFIHTIGSDSLSREEGKKIFSHIITHNDANVLVIKGDKRKIDNYLGIETAIDEKNENCEIDKPVFIAKVITQIKNIICDMLMVSDKDFDINRYIQDYGFNSISIVDLTNQINEKFGINLMPSIYFQYGTVFELANYLYDSKRYEIVFVTERHQDMINHITIENELTTELEQNVVGFEEDYSKNIEENFDEDEIVVVGMSGILPLSDDIKVFFENLVNEKDLITNVPKTRWDADSFNEALVSQGEKAISKWGGFMNEVDTFDAEFFDISPREAQLMDPQQRKMLQVIWNTIEDSGHSMQDLWDTDTGLFLGVATSDYADVLRAFQNPIEAYTSTGASHCILTNRISYFFNWHGPSEPIDTACSSSLIAIHRAVESIKNHDCDQAIAGGVNIIASPLLHLSFSRAGMLSKDGKCKTFDKDADGYVRGEGCGAILLKRKSLAIAEGDHIYGIVKGTAINHGGKTNSLTAPNPKAQAIVIAKAYNKAGFSPDTVNYIELHGTGTKLGDAVESDGIKLAFDMMKEKGKKLQKNYCHLSSVKTNIGHLEAAAGIASFIKVLLAMKYKKIPGNIHLNSINPFIELADSPFTISKETLDWNSIRNEKGDIIPRRAGISGFGFGGANAHIAVEEYVEKRPDTKYTNNDQYIIVLSAKSKHSLQERVKDLVTFLSEEENSNSNLLDLAYTLQVGRMELMERLGVVVTNKDQLIQELKAYLEHGQHHIQISGDIGNQLKNEKDRKGIEDLIQSKDYEGILQQFVDGFAVDWKALYKNIKTRRLILPTYPFRKERHWAGEGTADFVKSFLGVETKKQVIENIQVYEEKRTSIESLEDKVRYYLKDILCRTSKVSMDKIKNSDSFERMGIDSIMIGELNEILSNDFEHLEPTIFFEYHTLDELVDYFMREQKASVVAMFGNDEENVQVDTFEESKQEFKKEKDTFENQDIAIIGINGKYPDADDLDEFWKNLCQGKDSIREVPKERFDAKKHYSAKRGVPNTISSKWGGFIHDVDKFDPFFFKITPKDAEHIDPQERLFLQNVYGTLEDAGYHRKALEKFKVGMFVGVIHGHYQFLAVEETLKGNLTSLYTSYASVANRASYFFDLKGPSMAIDTMCSSSLTAIHMACESIRRGECDMAVAGGVNLSIHIDKYIFLSQQRFLSSDGRCRAFGRGGDGYVPGEGVGSILLKPIDQAIKDGDNIYGIIKSSSLNHGGRTSGYSVSNPNAQSDVIVEALEKAKINPRSIGYIEAHGTGTELGDPIEIRGLVKAFRNYTNDNQFCSIGSVKTNIGHCEASAGIASLTKVILQIKNKKLVPSLHSKDLNQKIDFNQTPFIVQQELEEWKPITLVQNGKNETYPRRAGISSFGAGGSNVHMILEEYVPEEDSMECTQECREELMVMSAKTEECLKEYCNRFIEYFSQTERICNTNTLNRCINIVTDIMGMDKDSFDVDATFEEYGFQIFTYNRLIEQIRQEFSVTMSLHDIYKSPTTKALANEIDEAGLNIKRGKAVVNKANFADIAYTMLVGRESQEEYRVAIRGRSTNEIVDKLIEFVKDMKSSDTLLYRDMRQTVNRNEINPDEIRSMLVNRQLDKLAEVWCDGNEIDWNKMYESEHRHRISLPKYPFEKMHVWFTPQETKVMNLLEKLESGEMSVLEVEQRMEESYE